MKEMRKEGKEESEEDEETEKILVKIRKMTSEP